MHRIPAALLILTPLIPVAAQTPTVPDLAELRGAADAFRIAQERGDKAELERLLAPDFLFVRASGRVGDRREFIDGFTAPGIKLDPIRVSDPLLIRVSAEVAIVGGEAWLRGTQNGAALAQHYRFNDTFARRGGRWQVVYTQITPLPL
ncbi:nuclear transport factor 2 family protein [Sphingomonas sp.]|uniref:nuclear transport factor 2 family protein n=1 Tax=Sphingomonas sp. TaxID=28214 RepID=UPI003B3BB553